MIAPAVAAAGLKVSAPGRKSMPRLRPALARTRSWISSSGSASPRAGSTSTATMSGTARPIARPISPASHSATSARGPWPAPRNLTTYRPSSSASTRPGSEPPSRSGVTYRVARTVRITPQSVAESRRRPAPHAAAHRSHVPRERSGLRLADDRIRPAIPPQRARARSRTPVRPSRGRRPGMVPPRLHPVPAGPRLRQGALDARSAAPDRRGPDGLRDRPADRGQPARATTG